MNGSSFSPKLSMVIPNAHRAITSMVNVLKFLYRTLNNYSLDNKPRVKILCYILASNFPSLSAIF
jgi:hypothetical protein